jgi:hypothetical protein
MFKTHRYVMNINALTAESGRKVESQTFAPSSSF